MLLKHCHWSLTRGEGATCIEQKADAFHRLLRAPWAICLGRLQACLNISMHHSGKRSDTMAPTLRHLGGQSHSRGSTFEEGIYDDRSHDKMCRVAFCTLYTGCGTSGTSLACIPSMCSSSASHRSLHIAYESKSLRVIVLKQSWIPWADVRQGDSSPPA